VACGIHAVPIVINDSGEKTPQQRGGKNEVKRGGGMWVIHRPVVFKRIPPIDGGVNKWEWGSMWVTHAAPRR